MSVDTQPATERLMRFLSVEGVTGKEAAIGRKLSAALEESASTTRTRAFETGNLIVDLR